MVRLTRQRKTLPRVPRRHRRLAGAPWPPLAVLVGVAGVLWFAAEGYPNFIAATGAWVTNGNGAVVSHGRGAFVLCEGASAPNCVIDGDTIRYAGEKIRLADIDAPEVFSPRCASEAASGERATQRLLELINAGQFRLVAGGRDEDRYGRKLRTIERGGRSLGDVLVSEGLARRWDGARRSWCG